MTFGAHLKSLREQRGMTQRQLAALAEINYTTVCHMEKGSFLPSQKVIHRLATVLQVDAISLLTMAGRVPRGMEPMLEKHPFMAELLYELATKDLTEATYRRLLQLARTREEEWTDDLSGALMRIEWGEEQPRVTVIFAENHTLTIEQVNAVVRRLRGRAHLAYELFPDPVREQEHG